MQSSVFTPTNSVLHMYIPLLQLHHMCFAKFLAISAYVMDVTISTRKMPFPDDFCVKHQVNTELYLLPFPSTMHMAEKRYVLSQRIGDSRINPTSLDGCS